MPGKRPAGHSGASVTQGVWLVLYLLRDGERYLEEWPIGSGKWWVNPGSTHVPPAVKRALFKYQFVEADEQMETRTFSLTKRGRWAQLHRRYPGPTRQGGGFAPLK